MYKILVADDEGIVVQALEYIIQKNFGSECEVYTAKNGRQAIELAERCRPDIVLLDIQMPGINGLKATEEIHSRNPKVKTLILTAYDNFDYATTALRLGAVDYLNKPINKTLLVERLTGIMRQIDAERRSWESQLQEKEKLEAVGPIVENSFVLSLMIQNEYQEEGQLCRQLLEIDQEYGAILVIKWQPTPGRGGPNRRQLAQLIKVHFSSACVGSGLERKAVCVIPQESPELGYQRRTQMIERAKTMAEELKEKLGLEIKIGIGSVKPWAEMYESYQEALNALRHGKWTITHIEDLIIEENTPRAEGENLEQGLVKAVRSGLEHEARREATVYAGWLMKHQEMGLEEKKLRLMEVYLLARREAEERGGGPGNGQALKELLALAEEDALARRFIQAAEELAQSVVIQQSRTDNVVEKAQEYIQQNFARDLPLEEVACHAGISPYYFSRMFKEQTGTNYSEYLTEVRIETAKKLLMNPAINIKHVCSQSGYTNPNYFSRIFKKCVGVTPTEFRAQWLEGK